MDWFRHDTDAHVDIKVRKLLRDDGLKAYGLYWLVVELLYIYGGSISDDDLREELSMTDGEDLLPTLEEKRLLTCEDGVWSCQRVLEEMAFNEENRQKKSEAGKKGMASRWGNRVITNDNTVITKDNKPYQRITADNTLTITKPEPDNTESSSYKNVSQLIRNNSDSCKSADPHNAPAPNKGPEAGAPAKKTFITIISNRGDEVPIYQDMVDMWAKTYPAVDVKAELQRMKSWAISNPTNRKTSQGMTRFCDNWLKREQDRAGTRGAAPVRRDYSDVKPEDLDKEWSWNV